MLADKEEIYLTEIEEGHEPEVFWVALGGEDDYGSLLTGMYKNWLFLRSHALNSYQKSGSCFPCEAMLQLNHNDLD